MTALRIVGRGRIARALGQTETGHDIVVLPGRSPTFLARLRDAPPAPVLIAARDPAGSMDANLELAARLAHWARAAGIPDTRILHAGSYAAEAPRADTYSDEKRALEARVVRGEIPGRVLRLPIIRIEDDHFRSILSEIAWAVSVGLIAPGIRLPILSPDSLARCLISAPEDLPPVSIVGAQAIRVEDLILAVGVTPRQPGKLNARLKTLSDYSQQRTGISETHYESQMRRSSL